MSRVRAVPFAAAVAMLPAMPYQWSPLDKDERSLRLWPHRSLPPRGFAWFIGLTALLIGLPLLALLGSPVLWGMLPFVLGAVAAIWFALQRSYRDGAILEELRLWPDRITLTRHDPRRAARQWEANPHWVQVSLRATGGPVAEYLTLKGAGREVEIGAFLSVEERRTLYGDLSEVLRALR